MLKCEEKVALKEALDAVQPGNMSSPTGTTQPYTGSSASTTEPHGLISLHNRAPHGLISLHNRAPHGLITLHDWVSNWN